jgi:diguanylate cyclase (GGDEF)-like protein/PAS domain S-box-containing protein
MFDALSKQVAIVGADGRILDVNEAWRRFARENQSCGRSMEDSIGTSYLQVCEQAVGHPDGDEAAAAAEGIRAVLEGRQSEFRLEYPCHAPQEKRWFQMSVIRLVLPTPAVAISHENITTRKLAEIAREHANAMLRGLFELAPVGISLTDLHTLRTIDANTALCRIVGFTREELLAGDADGRAPYAQRLQRAQILQQALEAGDFGPLEGEFVHKDGHTVDVLLSGTRVIGPDGTPFLWSIEQDISARKSLERRLRVAAEQDPLTGLPNRAELLHRLEQMFQLTRADSSFCFAVLFLDLDRFKLVNDTLGHEAGDDLLLLMAQRLSALLPPRGDFIQVPSSFVARFGGDEFVYVAAYCDSTRAASVIADRLQTAISAPYVVKGNEFVSSVSIGIAIARGWSDGPHELLRNADTAMYEAKRVGGGSTIVFDERMYDRLSRSVNIEAGLRLALQRKEFTIHYQPIVDLSTGSMASVEALLRWTHPLLGPVSPGEFIPIAEDTGQIVAIGEWVLRESCLQWMRWQLQDASRAPAIVSVNLSRRQMRSGSTLLKTVRAALRDADMPASALQLEITEREVMLDPDGARELLLALKALGVRLAMDDFGTGTSSLGCLRDYPFHVVKIDKSFVTDLARDPHVLALAHATVKVIENLGMSSVAEGVEDTQELVMLQAMGCQYAQGYLFGRPMAADLVMDAIAGTAITHGGKSAPQLLMTEETAAGVAMASMQR